MYIPENMDARGLSFVKTTDGRRFSGGPEYNQYAQRMVSPHLQVLDVVGKMPCANALVTLNQHPTRLDIGYKGFGCGLCERDSIIRNSFESPEVVNENKLMSVLSEVSLVDGKIRGLETTSEIPWGCNTGFSNVYNLKNLTISTVVNRNYGKPVSLNLHNLMGKCKNPIKVKLCAYDGEESFIFK